MVEKKKLNTLHIVIYLILFFTIWSIRELIIFPILVASFDGLIFQIIETTMKLLVWALPAVLLIKYYQDDMWVGLKDLFVNKPRWFKSAPVLLLVFFPLLSAWVLHGEVAIRPNLEPLHLISLVVSSFFTEEIVFRGFLLNAFLKKMKIWKAIALDAILFTLIHYPIWIYLGNDLPTILWMSVNIVPLSVLFAFSFVKTKNILVACEI